METTDSSNSNFAEMAKKIFGEKGPVTEIFVQHLAPMCQRIGYHKFSNEQQMAFFLEFSRVLGLQYQDRLAKTGKTDEAQQQALYVECLQDLAKAL